MASLMWLNFTISCELYWIFFDGIHWKLLRVYDFDAAKKWDLLWLEANLGTADCSGDKQVSCSLACYKIK